MLFIGLVEWIAIVSVCTAIVDWDIMPLIIWLEKKLYGS